MPELSEILRGAVELGVLSTLVLFFAWQTTRREDRLAERIGKLESYIENTLSSLTTETLGVLRDATRAIENNSRVVEHIATRVDRLERKQD